MDGLPDTVDEYEGALDVHFAEDRVEELEEKGTRLRVHEQSVNHDLLWFLFNLATTRYLVIEFLVYGSGYLLISGKLALVHPNSIIPLASNFKIAKGRVPLAYPVFKRGYYLHKLS